MSERSSAEPTPLPAGTILRADPSLRTRDGGRLLIGGSPLRFIRLSEAGASTVKRWLAGEPVAASPGRTRLARRLIDAGMVSPAFAADDRVSDMTIVIPVKDDQEGLDAVLDALEPGPIPVVVVDDGSDPAMTIPDDLQDRYGNGRQMAGQAAVRIIRRPTAGGPGVARQEGLGSVSTPLVAFVDAGVGLTIEALADLGRWFADPEVVAVAPRVAPTPNAGTIWLYEQGHSPLDLGPNPSAVEPGRVVSYVPTTCLLARVGSIADAGGFDPDLRWGEDVDLVLRLAALGRVRYDPSVVVTHPVRPDLWALVRQRIGYGSAAAPLASRHGTKLAPVRMSGWSLGIWALAFSGRPFAAMVVAAGTAMGLSRKLAPVLPDHRVESVMLSARGHWYAGKGLSEAAVRVWWPATVLGLLFGPRKIALRLVLFAWLGRVGVSRGPWRERLRNWAFGVADDAAYGTGVWWGVFRERSARALMPLLAEWPGDEGEATGR